MANIKYEIRKKYKVIKELIAKHKRVRIIFNEHSVAEDGKVHQNSDSRRRIITKDGSCKVSYKGYAYRNWSGYDTSCFVDGEDINSFEDTLRLMRRHDGTWMIPVEVHYGFLLRKKVKL